MKLVLVCFLCFITSELPALVPEIVILHDGTHVNFERTMEWPQRLHTVFKDMKARLTFRLTQMTSPCYLKKLRMVPQKKLIGLMTLARCDRADTLNLVARKAYSQVPALRIDTEYCHEPGRLLLTWLKIDWPCFLYTFHGWADEIKTQQESFYFPSSRSSRNVNALVDGRCPFQLRIATHVVDVYEEKHRRNILNGHVLRIGILNNSQFWLHGDLSNPETLVSTGAFADQLKDIAHVLNFSMKFIIPESQLFGSLTRNGSWTGLVGIGVNRQIDVVGYPANFMHERHRIVDWIFSAFDNTFAFVLPPPDVERHWLASAQPYQYNVWICLLGMLFALGLSVKLYHHIQATPTQTNGESFLGLVFNYLRGLLNQGGDDSVHNAPSRIVMGVWYIFALLTINLYTSVLIRHLSFPRLKPLIRNLDELAQLSHVRAVFFNNSSFNPIVSNPNATGSVALVAQRGRQHPEDFVRDFGEAIEQVATKGTRVYADALFKASEAVLQDYQKHGYCRISFVQFNYFTVPGSFPLPKGSSYWHFLYNAQARIVEVGVFSQTVKKLLPPNPCQSMTNFVRANTRLTLADLQSPFVLSIIGISMSIVSFLVELCLECCPRPWMR